MSALETTWERGVLVATGGASGACGMENGQGADQQEAGGAL